MTITKARERLGLKENETIYADGIKALMENTKQRLNTWSLPNYLQVLRHEMVHAMFYECGLTDYMRDETLVEALACIYPKAMNDFATAGIALTKLMLCEEEQEERNNEIH